MVRDEHPLSAGDFDAAVNAMDSAILAVSDQPGCEIENLFTPEQYHRVCTMPAGQVGSSMIHTVEHLFAILEGVLVVRDQDGIQILSAPHIGITKAGTRRALFTPTGAVWMTSHPNPDNCRDVETLVRRLTEEPVNPDIPEGKGNHWRIEHPTPALTE